MSDAGGGAQHDEAPVWLLQRMRSNGEEKCDGETDDKSAEEI